MPTKSTIQQALRAAAEYALKNPGARAFECLCSVPTPVSGVNRAFAVVYNSFESGHCEDGKHRCMLLLLAAEVAGG